MVLFLTFGAFALFIAGAGVTVSAASAIHEILATLLFGFSFLMVGLAGVVSAINRVAESMNRLVRAVGAGQE